MPSRPIFMVYGRVRRPEGKPAAGVHVAIVDADPDLDDLLGVGFTARDGGFQMSFTAEAFNQEKGESETSPDLYIVVSEKRDGVLVPLLRKDYGKLEYLLGGENLGEIVIAEDAPADPSLRPAPGRAKVTKRLRLDREILLVALREVAPVVEQLTGFTNLLAGLRYEIVDDFIPQYRERAASLAGRTLLDDDDLARFAYYARSCELDVCAMWQVDRNALVLNRPLLEEQGLDFLKVTLGHELVHVGQSRLPATAARMRAAVEDSYKEIFAGVPVDPAREKEIAAFMANVEGYAHYVETLFLRRVHTHAEPVGRVTRAADERFRFLEHAKPAVAPDATKSKVDLLVERLLTSKVTQYEAGCDAYAKRGAGDRPVPFDPDLRPELEMLFAAFRTLAEAIKKQPPP